MRRLFTPYWFCFKIGRIIKCRRKRSILILLQIDGFKKWKMFIMLDAHYVKSVRIRSYSGPYFPAFGLNTERYGVSLRIQFECGTIWTRLTPNTDSFQAVIFAHIFPTMRFDNESLHANFILTFASFAWCAFLSSCLLIDTTIYANSH